MKLKPVDYSFIKTEFIRILRGRRSKNALSRHLGYSFNQVQRWEASHKALKWRDFVALAQTCGRDLRSILGEVFLYSGDTEEFGAFLRHIKPNITAKKLADDLRADRQTAARWLRGQTSPPCETALKMIHLYTGLFPVFCQRIATPSKIKMIEEISYEEQLKFDFDHPYAGAIRESLDTVQYKSLSRHNNNLIAKMVGISMTEAQEAISAMERFGTLVLENKKYANVTNHISHGGYLIGSAQITKYWTERMIHRFETKNNIPRQSQTGKSHFAHWAAAASPEAIQKVSEIWTRCHHEMVECRISEM